MRTLNISITETEYKQLGLKGDSLSFSEFIALLRSELSKPAYVEDVAVAENYGHSKLLLDESAPESKVASRKRLSFSDFSFSKSRKVLEDYRGSLSDAVIEERRSAL